VIDLSEVQRIVVKPHATPRLDIAFLRVADRSGMASFLQRAIGHVTYANTPPDEAGFHVAISGAGIGVLEVGTRITAALPPTFLEGMRAAARRLGDRPEVLDTPFRHDEGPIHAAVIRVEGGSERRPAPDVPFPFLGEDDEVAGTWVGHRRDAIGSEPFGFADGVTDPVIAGVPGREHVEPGNGIWDAANRRWRAVATGEAVLGHADEVGAIAGHPDAALIERDSSYLVIRRLRQDVQAFDEACADLADATGLDSEQVAEQIVGRKRSGAPLGDATGNDFLYRSGDRPRSDAPPTAHIRRANPRDDLTRADVITPRHQLFRRGLPYKAQEGDEGLLFLAVCADLRRQFEFVQARWLQDGTRLGLGVEPDGLTGRRPEPAPGPAAVDRPAPDDALYGRVSTRAIDGGRVGRSLASFVTPTGGEYFLLPGRGALSYLLGCSLG